MKNSILAKLHVELAAGVEDEPQAVYVLSRIRKILEIENVRQYKILKFYCNWALHAEIEDVSSVQQMVDGLLHESQEKNLEALSEFTNFRSFFSELRQFLSEHSLPTALCDDQKSNWEFRRILSQIYSDTPLVLKSVTKTRLVWEGEQRENSWGGGFRIEKI